MLRPLGVIYFKEKLVYYHLGFIFKALAISYDNTLLTKVIAEIWEHGDIT